MAHPDATPRPAIARVWRGCTPRERADEYARYLYEEGVRPLIDRALGVQMFREDRETESEFMTISYWESVEAMSLVIGDDPRRVHHLARDPEFLTRLPAGVQVLNVMCRHGQTGW